MYSKRVFLPISRHLRRAFFTKRADPPILQRNFEPKRKVFRDNIDFDFEWAIDLLACVVGEISRTGASVWRQSQEGERVDFPPACNLCFFLFMRSPDVNFGLAEGSETSIKS